MANLGKDDIRHLASLARIAVNQDEEDMYGSQLSSILKYVEQLDGVDTAGLEPTSQVTGLSGVARADDDTSDTMPRQKLLEQTPKTDGKNIRVPKVI